MAPASIVGAFTLSPEDVSERDTSNSSERDRRNQNAKVFTHCGRCSHSGEATLKIDMTIAPKHVPAMKITVPIKNSIFFSPEKAGPVLHP
jgi:hypothetical protein